MANRGRLHRDDDSSQIPVSEFLSGSDGRGEPEVERRQQILAEALLNRKPHPGQAPFAVAAADQPAAIPSGSSRAAVRLLVVAAAAAVLAGALIATQVINSAPDTTTGTAGAQHLRGAKVFRPDVIRASLNTGEDAAPAGSPGQPPAAGTAPDTTAGQPAADQARPSATTTDGGTTAGQQTGSGSSSTSAGSGPSGSLLDPLDSVTDPVLGPILTFYAAAPSEPATAYALLHPSVQEGDFEDFANSWKDVQRADIENATPDGRNAFVVQVLLVRDDGSRLVTRQRIEVGTGRKPKIVDATMLSVELR